MGILPDSQFPSSRRGFAVAAKASARRLHSGCPKPFGCYKPLPVACRDCSLPLSVAQEALKTAADMGYTVDADIITGPDGYKFRVLPKEDARKFRSDIPPRPNRTHLLHRMKMLTRFGALLAEP